MDYPYYQLLILASFVILFTSIGLAWATTNHFFLLGCAFGFALYRFMTNNVQDTREWKRSRFRDELP